MPEETILNQPEAININPTEVNPVNAPAVSTEEAPKEVPKMDVPTPAPENTVATNVINTESSVPAEPTEHKEPIESTVAPAPSDTPIENKTEKAETVQPLEPTEPATSQPATQPNIIQPETATEAPAEIKPAEQPIKQEEKPKEEEHHWAGLVEDWRYRYKNRWATDYHIQMLLALHIITNREAEYIRTGK